MTMDRWRYLLVLAACFVITAPLEFLGSGVYRHTKRTAAAVIPLSGLLTYNAVDGLLGRVRSLRPKAEQKR